ncbi:MAG: response regulator [Mesorhizobium sp.]|nr:MAG: response regulator [Mesorhizobium sp.]TJX78256.1 MAG: response regulator [Mesorhizobium sp.]
MRDVRGLQLLIVEDEWLLADDLARYFSSMGATILGPVATIEQAFHYTDNAQAAILDININGRRVFPVADELQRRGIPFVFFTGDSESVIPDRLRYASNLRKSSGSQAVFDALFPQRGVREESAATTDDVLSILPKLRLAARLGLGDVAASDRLVEKTLEQALRDIDRRAAGLSTEEWLNEIMRTVGESCGAKLLH